MSRLDYSNVIRLTTQKTLHIIERDGLFITGYVLSGKTTEGDVKCIVDQSAVRWMGATEHFRMMHPTSGDSNTLVQKYRHTAKEMVATVSIVDSWVNSADFERVAQLYAHTKFELLSLQAQNPNTRKAAMTEVVEYQYRHFDTHPDTVTSGQWTRWENVSEAKYRDILDYIADGHSYQVRRLGVIAEVPANPDYKVGYDRPKTKA